MNANEMIYKFKLGYNKLDSENNRELLIPEIDSMLNQAADLYVKLIAEPRIYNHLGFETNTRSIEDISNIVSTPTIIDVVDNKFEVPSNYLYDVKMTAEVADEVCDSISLTVFKREHDDNFNESEFDKSNLGWRFVNVLRNKDGFMFVADFKVSKVILTYIEKMPYIHSANLFGSNGYKLLDGTNLIGMQDCVLNEGTHQEIVDLAIYLASGNTNDPELPVKAGLLNINKLI